MKTLTLAGIILIFCVSSALGAGSKSYAPAVAPEIRDYNKGVALMLDRKFSRAEKMFRKALARQDQFAEAHNNLAYVLRKQGPENYDEALRHYNRAIALKPTLPQPYMYRGVLYVQMGRVALAETDYNTLAGMDARLSSELQYVIDNGREKEPEQFFGVSQKLK